MTCPIIDLHVHVLPPDIRGPDAYVSSTQWNWPSFLYLRVRHRIRRREPVTGDAIMRRDLARAIADMRHVDQVVALALDAACDEAGSRDWRRTHFFVANDYVLHLTKENHRVLAGVSVNPKRRDALAELDRCLDEGAVLLKWLPCVQGFHPMDRALIPFYRRMADARLPLLCHTGPEYALTTSGRSFVRIEDLRLALDEGVTVIAAHGGGADIREFGRAFRVAAEMLLNHSNLYADTSAFSQPNRFWFMGRLLDHPELHPKLVHGSDVPLPVVPWVFLRRLPLRQVVQLSRVASPIDRDYLLKRALGFPSGVFQRGHQLLRRDRTGTGCDARDPAGRGPAG
jgi:predicted TIM-barrel fold metal-dependent hydrolase